MRRQKKQRPGDEALVLDESADSVERTSALLRLAVDGRSDLIPVARAWLTHVDGELRSEALNMLFGWCVEDVVPIALKMLHNDPDPSVRGMAASRLSGYLDDNESLRETILGALVRQLELDSDPITQRSIYEHLLEHIAPGIEHPKLPLHFDRDRDVNWQLLAPWRRH